jgi:hypothetical protein
MDGAHTSLRSLVDKWFAPTHEAPARVMRFGRARLTHCRYVRMQGFAGDRILTIWLPPRQARPLLAASTWCAAAASHFPPESIAR